ncbi:dockerin type I repeat-containing protein [Thermosulfurimonas dismutans]|uniref:Dockerin domain-containing protein n=1 Tax=Thermosulfurimonas dismutans TaxID=999894 RepID=A0A179D4A7_9BACT|nr:dockerin type I repeat-containing protein [Thermosulfurimonas dismutans]OAQ20910.1 hypothetical protein TDIS_1037 [Thermosulfurimonas dismutans]
MVAFLLFLSLFVLCQTVAAQEVFYPFYATSIPPLRSFALSEWGDTTGIVVEAPENTVAIEVLVNAPGTKLLVYEISINGSEIISKTKVGEALSQGPGWLRVPVPKLDQKKLFYLKIDFQEAEGYRQAVIADSPVWPKDGFWMVSRDRWLWRLEWGEDHPYGGVDNSGLVPRPFIRFVREGSFKLERFEPQPGIVLQGAKMRFKIWCFDFCPELKLDFEGDGEFDSRLTETDSRVSEFYHSYRSSGIYYPKVCSEDEKECFESVVVVGPPTTEISSLFSENFVVYWPKSKSFIKPYAERLLKYSQRAKDTGYFKYWGFEKDWAPNIAVYYYSTDINFARELCNLESGNSDDNYYNCSNNVMLASYITGVPFWHLLGAISSGIASADTLLHELAHALDHILNLSRAFGGENEIIPMWRNEGLVVTFAGNPGYGYSQDSRHATAKEVFEASRVLENFIHLRSDEIFYRCGGAATECYTMSTSLNGIIFPIFWVKEPQDKIVQYWNLLAYQTHEEVFPQIFGYNNDELWQKLFIWTNENIPSFNPPELKLLERENLEFSLQGSGDYFVLVYVNGSAHPTRKIRVHSQQSFSLKEFKNNDLKSIRLFVRQVKDSTGGLPLLSEAGRDFLLVFEPETSYLLNLTQYNGASVIYSAEINNWDFSPEAMLYQEINNFSPIPEIFVYQEKICFDFRPFTSFITVEPITGPAEWYLPPPPEDSSFRITVAQPIGELEEGFFCYSIHNADKYALLHLRTDFVQKYYDFTPVDQYLGVRLPVVKALYKRTCTPDGDVAPLGNRDGQVNIGDALVALRFALGLERPSDEDLCHADVAPLGQDGKPQPDGKITIGDAVVILRKALGLVNW